MYDIYIFEDPTFPKNQGFLGLKKSLFSSAFECIAQSEVSTFQKTGFLGWEVVSHTVRVT